jgi:signal transduction histidine kinase/HAMP domain-containing protein
MALTVASATLALAWLAGWRTLVRLRPGPAVVSFDTAVALVLLGGALTVLCLRPSRPQSRIGLNVTAAAALAAAGLAAVSLAEDLFGVSLGLDHLVVTDHWSAVGHPGRMAPEIAAVVLLVGTAAAIDVWWPHLARLVAGLGGAAGVVLFASATELAGSNQQLFGLAQVSPVGLTAVVLGLVAVLVLELAVSDRAGLLRRLVLERSVRASFLREFVLPVPIIMFGALCVASPLANRAHPGAGDVVAEVGAAAIAALVVLSVILGSRAASRIAGPLEEMNEVAARIAAGSYDTLVTLGHTERDEVGQLARAFARMRRELATRAQLQLVVQETYEASAGAPDLSAALRAFAGRLRREVDFDQCTYARTTDGGELRVEACVGQGTWQELVGTTLVLPAALQARFDSQGTAVDESLAGDPAWQERWGAAFDPSVRSSASVPVVVGGTARAVVSFFANHPHAFGPAELAMLEAAVRHAASILDMAYGLEQQHRAVERLEELDGLKNEFVGLVAHDLRSPMAVISGFADTLRLRWNVLTSEQRDDFLTTISRNVHGLSGMVDDILQVARIESGDFSYQTAAFDVGTLVERTVAEVAQAFDGRPTRVDVARGLPMGLADEQRVWQVVTNLVSNACKFSSPGDPVTVRVAVHGGFLRVEVTDRGPGIAAEDRDRIFDKFTRLAPADGGQSPKGTGLGLYICRSMVTGQGGSIGVEPGPGGGSTFWFTIPTAPATVILPNDQAHPAGADHAGADHAGAGT